MATIHYLKNPDLPFVKTGVEGNKFINGRFVNSRPRKQPNGKDFLSWSWSSEAKAMRKAKRKDKFRLRLQENHNFMKGEEDVIVWLGHAAFYIRINGVQILTDPCLGNVALLKRMVGLPCEISELTDIDYILMSHGHRDHFDVPSLKKVTRYNPQAQFLLPLEIGALLKQVGSGFSFQEAAWWQQYQIEHKDLKITFLPARHWNRRFLKDFNLNLWGSFMLETPTKRIYFSGDTAYDGHFKEIKAHFGKIDVVMMPIGAYLPSFIMQESHVNPAEAAQAFNELGADTFIPMHYGTYDLSSEPIGEPIRLMQQYEKSGELKGKLANLAVGEELYF